MNEICDICGKLATCKFIAYYQHDLYLCDDCWEKQAWEIYPYEYVLGIDGHIITLN